MSLSDLSAIGSFINGVGVLVSLVFLYFQLRQVTVQVKHAERNQQAAIQQERSSQVSDILMKLTDPSLAEAVSKGAEGREDLTRTQFLQFQAYALARLTISEDTFLQYKGGLLTVDAYGSFTKTFAGAFNSPGVRVLWPRFKGIFHPDFVAFADGLMAAAPVAEPTDGFADFRADLAAGRRSKADEVIA